MKHVSLSLQGTSPLLMHSDALADPLSPITKEFKKVSGKRSKTDDDHEAMARMEFYAGLYRDDSGAIVLPAPNVMRCLIEGARVTKRGPKVERGVVVTATAFPLQYDGPGAEKLYGDARFISRMSVKVGTARTMRVRPKFSTWGTEVTLLLDEAIVDPAEVLDIAATAGALIGLGDYRKGGGFGRFTAALQ